MATTFKVTGMAKDGKFIQIHDDYASLVKFMQNNNMIPQNIKERKHDGYIVISDVNDLPLYRVTYPTEATQTTEILTLEQLLPRNSADIQLAKFLNDGWTILCISHHVIHLGNGEADTRMRIVTLKREITD